jgi:hypothetical protein
MHTLATARTHAREGQGLTFPWQELVGAQTLSMRTSPLTVLSLVRCRAHTIGFVLSP